MTFLLGKAFSSNSDNFTPEKSPGSEKISVGNVPVRFLNRIGRYLIVD
jgi:hypothetical protein